LFWDRHPPSLPLSLGRPRGRAAPPDPILTAPQVAALLARFDETVARVKELEQLAHPAGLTLLPLFVHHLSHKEPPRSGRHDV